MLHKFVTSLGVAVTGIAICASSAQALPVAVYMNDFSVDTADFSSSSLSNDDAVDLTDLTQYHGNFTATGSSTLTLTGLPTHTMLSLKFDLYLFSTWDGNGDSCCGPDYFSLADDVTFAETFSNHQTQSYPGTPTETYGSGSIQTQVYRMLGPTMDMSEFLIGHSSSTFSVTFGGPTTQNDEWWGIDNVIVTIDEVTNGTPMPEPGTLALFGIGLAGLGFARRRKAAA